MKQITERVALATLLLTVLTLSVSAQARIRDITEVEGVQSNTLTGIGLVFGLNKTGDGGSITQRSIANFIKRANLTGQLEPGELSTENVAMVLVTAEQVPFARAGNRLDVNVSSMGDASSLRGGTLLLTPLVGVDGKVYATATGRLTVGGVTAQGQSGSSETINHPTAGQIAGGATVVDVIEQKMVGRNGTITLLQRDPSFANAEAMSQVINGAFPGSARALDGIAVTVSIPEDFRTRPVAFLKAIREMKVKIEQRAVVVINEQNGIIVAGGDVVVLPGVISKSNLTISVRETPEVSQPNPVAGGDTVVVPRSEVEINENGTPLIPIKGGVGADELAETLNALGASSLDMIAIFQELKKAGMLHAEIKTQ